MKTNEGKTNDPIRPPRKTEKSLRVNYTEKELLEIGKKLAEASQELSAAESEKKSVTATLKAKCDSIASRIEQHANELSSGYTYRNVPCEIRYDTPTKGQKTTVRIDNDQIVEVEAMTLAEMQADLPLTERTPDGEVNLANGKIERRPKAAKVDAETGAVVTPGDEGKNAA